MTKRLLVTGAGGFIGHHLVNNLVSRGYWVRGVDIKWPEYERSAAHEFDLLDLRDARACQQAVQNVDEIYHLAADMGGIGYITSQHAQIARNNTLINVGLLDAAHKNQIQRFLFSSSACVYPQSLQVDANVVPLREDHAWPADPEEGYGLEKLYMEKLCQYYMEDYGLETRVVRFHNVFGPLGSFDGGKEKAPAAICRKVALAEDGGEIEVWGDGEQTRSFMYVDDCIEGIYRLMQSECRTPLNLGTDVMVTINELVDIVSAVARKKVSIRHDLSKPQGVRGRNSDNGLLREKLGWEPCISLSNGFAPTYEWIADQVADPAAANAGSELPQRQAS